MRVCSLPLRLFLLKSVSFKLGDYLCFNVILGPFIQSIVSLMSSLMTKSLTVVAKVFFKNIDIFAAKM